MPLTKERMFNFTAGHIFGLSALFMPPIAILAPKGLAVLFVLTVLPFIIAGLAGKRIDGLWAGSGIRLAAAFVILAMASSLWSMTPEVSMKKAFILAFFLFGGVFLTRVACRLDYAAKRTFDTGLIVGGGLGFVLIGIEVTFDSPLYRILAGVKGHIPQEYNYQKLVVEQGFTVIEAKVISYKGYIRSLLGQLNQGASVGAIFLLPWTIAVKRQKGPLWAAASFAIGITILAYCIADSHKVALAIGLLAALAVFIGDRAALKGFSLLIIFGVLAAPWTVSFLPDPLQPNNTVAQLPNSSQHRLVIWQTTAAHIFERPVFGSGFNTARAFYGEDQRVINYFGGKKSHGPNLIPSTWASYFEPIPLHPHNGVLQVWLELGAAGALLLAAGLFLIVRRLGGVENRFERAMVFGSFITGLVVFCVSYGAWQSWWMGTIWLMMFYGAASCQDKSQ